MSTEPATIAAPAKPAIPAATPTPAKQAAVPKPGSLVRVVMAFGASQRVTAYATVLTIAPAFAGLVGADGQPSITIALFNPDTDARILGSGEWHRAFQRMANVAHASHEDVVKGGRGVYWVDVLDAPADALAEEKLPEIEGRESTVFSRRLAEETMEQPAKTVPAAVEPVSEARTQKADAAPESDANNRNENANPHASEAPETETPEASSTTLTNNGPEEENPA